jgi:ABC-type branched-subunit amino acid transport system substrate-binding protein
VRRHPYDGAVTQPLIGKGRSILVGGLGPLTTPGIPQAGAELRTGMKIAIDDINRAGGLLGQRLELRFADTQGIPAFGEAAAKALQAQGASVLLGEYHSVVADAISAAPWHEVPFICSSAVLDSITARRCSWVFRICPPQSRGWQLFARFILEAGYRRVVSLIEPNAYWSAGAGIIRNHLGQSGSEVVEFEVDAEGRFADVAVASVLSESPRPLMVLLLIGYPEPLRSVVARVRRESRLADLTLGDPAGRTIFPDWSATVGQVPADVPFLCYLIPSGLAPKGREFLAAYRQHLGRDPSFVAYEAYDSVLTFAEAARQAGTTDGDQLAQALRKVSVDGTRSMISFETDDEGVVHQQCQSGPLCVAAHDRAEQSLSSLKVLLTAED